MTTQAEKDFLNKVKPVAQKLIDVAMTEGKPYGITDAEVKIASVETQRGGVEKGEVSEAVSGAKLGVEVTLYAGKRVMSFSKNTLDEKKLCDAIRDNMQVIHLVPENENNVLLPADKVQKQQPDNLDLFEDNQADQAQLIDYVRRMEAAALAVPGIKTTDRLHITKTSAQTFTLATNGLERHTAETQYAAQGEMIAEGADGKMEGGYDVSVAHHFSDMADPAELGRRGSEETVARLNPALPATGEMPIVLSHDAGEEFISEAVLSAINAGAVFTNDTFLKGKVGEQVMSDGITLVDDPTIVRGLGSGTLDSAGLEMKPVTFIEKGVLKTFNASVMEANQIGMEPIGREDGPTNTIVQPGTLTPDELIADIKDGIYVKGFNGGTVNTANGQHSREAYGVLIKDGKITDQPVAGFVVSGNLKKMFMSVAVANDTPQLPSTKYNIAVPTLRINGCTIAGQ